MASQEEDPGSSRARGRRADAVVPPDRVFEAKPIWKRMVVILAGVTMNALFAWAAFTFLASKNGRQIDPVTTVGRVIDELLPAGGAALKQIRPGDRITARQRRHRWRPGTTCRTASPTRRTPRSGSTLDDGPTVVLPIHPDALEERVKAAQALQPFRAGRWSDRCCPDKPAAKAGVQAGDTIVAMQRPRRVEQWYDLLEILQGSDGQTAGAGGRPERRPRTVSRCGPRSRRSRT